MRNVYLIFFDSHLEQHFQLSQQPNFSPIEPLKNLNILDIGCGGGIATESLARVGANVLGVDASSNNVMIAKSHLLRQPPAIQQRVSYESSLVEKILEQRQAEQKDPFDVVVALEILEHVEQVPQFLETCSKLLKPNGALFLSTLNKTVQSYLLGIVAAEYVLNLVPVGTHDWNKFIRPEDLSTMLSQYQVQVRDVKGLSYTPWKQSISNDTGVNYMLFATKQAPK